MLTQGDPAGIGPEILLKALQDWMEPETWQPLVVAERAALEVLRHSLPAALWKRLSFLPRRISGKELEDLGTSIPVFDPVRSSRRVTPGRSDRGDARGAIAALDAGVELVTRGIADAIVTGPVSKASIAQHVDPEFRGHTDYLARAAGRERYGRDYLMTFLSSELQVALLNTHIPLAEAVGGLSGQAIFEALHCLHRHAGGRIAVAGLNPHAGEGGLMGTEDEEKIGPAVEAARIQGIDAYGPESPDSLFARARRGEFDWVLALYHDQGLIAVKTLAFGTATNWTLGLPYVRTSVDHGTAFDLAGRGRADEEPLRQVVASTLRIVNGELPRRS